MNVFLQRVVEVHIKKNLEMKILVLVMAFMTVSGMVMVDVVVDGMLIFISKVVDSVLISMISVEEDADVIVICISMMKMMLVITMMRALMIMKILLHTMGVLDSHMNTIVLLVDGYNHRGHSNRDDPDGIARVKLSLPKFSGREDAKAYLEWEKKCD